MSIYTFLNGDRTASIKPNGFGITLYHFAWVGILIKDQHYKYNLNSDHCGGLYV